MSGRYCLTREAALPVSATRVPQKRRRRRRGLLVSAQDVKSPSRSDPRPTTLYAEDRAREWALVQADHRRRSTELRRPHTLAGKSDPDDDRQIAADNDSVRALERRPSSAVAVDPRGSLAKLGVCQVRGLAAKTVVQASIDMSPLAPDILAKRLAVLHPELGVELSSALPGSPVGQVVAPRI